MVPGNNREWLERWTRVVIRFRVAVLAAWLLVTALGTLAAIHLPPLLTTSLAVPGTSSQTADDTLVRYFGDNPEGTFTVVFPVRDVSERGIRRIQAQLAMAARGLPSAHTEPVHTGSGIAFGNIVTRLDLQEAERYTETLRHTLSRSIKGPVYVTGAPALQHDLIPILAQDLQRGESIAIPIALLILALVLGIRAVLLVPLLFAGSTITAALAVVYVLAHAFLMVSYVPNLVELMGLGLAIDYSLLVVQRFREEVVAGGTVDDAIVRTMATAGRAVIFSGAAVAIGLSVVLIMPVPFIRSLGVAGVIVPLVSILAALTVQPALLAVLGRAGLRTPRLMSASLRPSRLREQRVSLDQVGDAPELGWWAVMAREVMRWRRVVLLGSLVLLGLLAVPATGLQVTPGSLSAIPQFTPSARGLALIDQRLGPGVLTPIQVVVDTGRPGLAGRNDTHQAALRLASAVLQDREVFIAAVGSRPPYVDPSRRYNRATVYPRHAFGEGGTQRLVTRLRQTYIQAAHFPSGYRISSGGAPAEGVDFLSQVYGTFPWVILLALAFAYLVLLRAFRSLLLPLLAMLLDLISVAAAYGMLVVVFRLGIGADLLGLYRTPEIEGWVPVFLFATLFGLSMDYQVFLVTRMRERWDEGAGNSEAVAYGIERTGRIVSAAAVIMVVSFSGFMVGRVAGLQELGAGLTLGILLDATVVRILLMPSVMGLLGRWCWWLPAIIAGPIRVEASPLAEREGRGLWKRA